MTGRPSAEMRRAVIERAGDCCEYCLIHQSLAASTHQVDHVIAEKHQGETTLENLALSCTLCNRRKSSDIGSLDPETGELVRLFNPRTQDWGEHFRLTDSEIIGVTPEGRTTVEFLQFNSYERVVERLVQISAGIFVPRKSNN